MIAITPSTRLGRFVAGEPGLYDKYQARHRNDRCCECLNAMRALGLGPATTHFNVSLLYLARITLRLGYGQLSIVIVRFSSIESMDFRCPRLLGHIRPTVLVKPWSIFQAFLLY